MNRELAQDWRAPGRTSPAAARVAILEAPEAGSVADMLEAVGFDCRIAGAAEIAAGIRSGEEAAAILIPEALDREKVSVLAGAITEQPPWSDFPFLLLIDRRDVGRHSGLVAQLANVLMLERPLDPAVAANAVRAALRSRERQREAAKHLRASGDAEAHLKQLAENLKVKVRERMGEVRSAHESLVQEIEDRKQAERARLDAEERYRLAAQATSDAIWDLDLTAGAIEWCGSESSFFGYPAAINPTSLDWWKDRVHPSDRGRVSAGLEATLGGTATHWTESYRFFCANGEWADVYDRGFIIRDDAGRAQRVVGAMSDFTERRRAEAELRRVQAELVHVSRLSAMGAMASTLAHELNQPLTAVVSYIRGGLRRLEEAGQAPPAEVRSALESAEAGALKAGQIVRGLRELVARGIVNVKPENLTRLIQEASVLAFVDEQAQGVTHRVDIDPAAHWVEADGIQIQQVLINLVRNAIEAMAGRQRREIVIATRPAADHMIEVSVADTGQGLSPELRQALFKPFQSRKAEGMGIGLSISRTIVEAHGGRIWAENAPDEGAVFRFTLPTPRPRA